MAELSTNDTPSGPTDESLDTLLAVQATDNVIHLRIGGLTITDAQPSWRPTTCLFLRGCSGVSPSVISSLLQAIGLQCEYRPVEDDQGIETTIWLDYEREEIQIRSRSVETMSEPLTIDDIKMQYARLASMYQYAYESWRKNERRSSNIIHRVKIELLREIDRNTRKAFFFRASRPDKAESYRLQLDAYQHILRRLTDIEQDPDGE